MNALKSGIDAKSQIIRGEKAANLETLAAEYYDRFHPTAPEQRMLVDTLIDCEWLLRRFRVCEAQLWEHGAVDCFMPKDEIRVGQAYRSDCDYFARLQRRIDTAHRNYRNALQELRRIQAAETPGPEPATATNQIAKPQNGFVPPTDYVMSPVSPTDVAQALVPAGADTPVGAGERSSPNR